jgi:hypothetical protein
MGGCGLHARVTERPTRGDGTDVSAVLGFSGKNFPSGMHQPTGAEKTCTNCNPASQGSHGGHEAGRGNGTMERFYGLSIVIFYLENINSRGFRVKIPSAKSCAPSGAPGRPRPQAAVWTRSQRLRLSSSFTSSISAMLTRSLWRSFLVTSSSWFSRARSRVSAAGTSSRMSLTASSRAR